MCLKKMSEEFLKKMRWFDIPLLKLAVFFFTLFLVAVWPGFRNLVVDRIGWAWLLVISVVLMAVMIKKMCMGMCNPKKTVKKAAKKKK